MASMDREAEVSMDEAWAAAESAFYLPDDGIVDWSLTVWHDRMGWHATAWRTDTSDTETGPHGSAVEALRVLAEIGGERWLAAEEQGS